MEIRNIAILFYLFVVHLFSGKFSESRANLAGCFHRFIEMITDFFYPAKVECNICGWKGGCFKTFVATIHIRRNALCPKCLSLERHREFMKLFLVVEGCFTHKPIRILDIAPNKGFSDYCKLQHDIEYLSVDLVSKIAMKHMDLQNLQLDDKSFDLVVCFHVLDYLVDDEKGMKEIFRVLAENGIAITQEGIDFSLISTLAFDKSLAVNHFRRRQYGRDFFQKWEQAGFCTHKVFSEDLNSITLISVKPVNPAFEKLGSIIFANRNFKKPESKLYEI